MAVSASRTPVLRIAQITDTHLHADPEGRLLGLNTRACLEQVVALATRRQPQLTVVTGDLTHDASPQAYRHLERIFARLGTPVYCLPGNHDERDALRVNLNAAPCHSQPHLHIGGWLLAFVDSTVAGAEGGHLADEELRRLDTTLEQSASLPTIIWLHHQPVKVGSRWLDTMAVDNAEAFFRIVDRHPQVRAVVWGHVHQCFEQQRNQVALLATPSTCIQFQPLSEEFAIDPSPPGYRWIDLYSDGTLRTGVERLEAVPGALETRSSGY